MPAFALHLLLGLPDGRLADAAAVAGWSSPATSSGVVLGGVLMADRDELVAWPLVLLWWLVAVGLGLWGSHARYVSPGAVDRRRMQWVGWGMAVGDRGRHRRRSRSCSWPTGRRQPGVVALALTGLVPISLVFGVIRPASVARVDRLLTHTVVAGGADRCSSWRST